MDTVVSMEYYEKLLPINFTTYTERTNSFKVIYHQSSPRRNTFVTIRDTEFVVKNLLTKQTTCSNDFTSKFCQQLRQTLRLISHKLLKNTEKEKTLSSSLMR